MKKSIMLISLLFAVLFAVKGQKIAHKALMELSLKDSNGSFIPYTPLGNTNIVVDNSTKEITIITPAVVKHIYSIGGEKIDTLEHESEIKYKKIGKITPSKDKNGFPTEEWIALNDNNEKCRMVLLTNNTFYFLTIILNDSKTRFTYEK